MPALIRSADIFVSTARYEPFGSAALSAMACGKPIIANAVGGYADAVVDGTTGLLLPPGRPQLLVKRLRDLARHAHEADRVRNRGRRPGEVTLPVGADRRGNRGSLRALHGGPCRRTASQA